MPPAGPPPALKSASVTPVVQIWLCPLFAAIMAKTSKMIQYAIRAIHARKEKASAPWYWEQKVNSLGQVEKRFAVSAAVAVRARMDELRR